MKVLYQESSDDADHDIYHGMYIDSIETLTALYYNIMYKVMYMYI